jgi:hypothetical protein
VHLAAYETNLIADSFADEPLERARLGIFDHLTNDIAFARDRTDDADLGGADTASAAMLALVRVFVAFFAADEGFVHFDHAHQFGKAVVVEHRANAMAHKESGLVGRRPAVLFEHPLDLQGAHSLLALADQVDDLEPKRQRVVGILKDSSDQRGEAIASALFALVYLAGFLVEHLSAGLADLVPRG